MTEKMRTRTGLSATLIVGLILALLGGAITFYGVAFPGTTIMVGGVIVAIIGAVIQFNRR